MITRFLLITLLLLIDFSVLFAQQIEPMNWWVGMKNPNLQLMIHGNKIGETTPFITYSGVTLKKVHKADSENYLFMDLIIAKTTKPGTITIDFKKNGKIISSYKYPLFSRQPNAAQLKGFTSSDVIYLLVPDRFANGDYRNDVVEGMKENKINRQFDGGRHGGDIRGIIDHLDYIAEMGYTAIWPTPLVENDMKAYSYHGYSMTNHYKVDPRFGTIDDYKELAIKAKQKGLKLILDEVLNHIGSNHWWMKDLPFKDWINFPDSLQLTNHRRTVNEDQYASEYDKELMKKGWFDKTMPDMNGQNPFVANYLIQSTIWWIETLQLGGIRQDTYGYSDKNLLKNWSCRIMNEYPNFSIVGEEWSVNPLITSYWQRGKNNQDDYISCLTSVMDFPLQSALVQALKEPESSDFGKGMTLLYEALANDIVYADPKNILIFGDNHDMDRLFTQLDQDVKLTRMALTYLLTIRGVPQIFYGTEVLMDNTGHHKVDGLIRSDFPGGWKGDTVNAFTGNGLTVEQKENQTYLKRLLNWRKNNTVLATEKTLHFAPVDNIYVYFRYTDSQKIMVIMNKNKKDKTINLRKFNEILKDSKSITNILTGEKKPLDQTLLSPGMTALVLEIR